MISRTRLLIGLAAYVVLAILAFFLLDGNFRLVVWILLGGLALRTFIASLPRPE